MSSPAINLTRLCVCLLISGWGACSVAWGDVPNAVLSSVFPPGGRAGTTFEVAIAGSALEGATAILCPRSGITFRPVKPGVFATTIAPDVAVGFYDLRTVGPNGLSSPRAFFVCNRPAQVELEPNDKVPVADSADRKLLQPNTVISGRIEKPGDIDQFQFAGQRGERIIIECFAQRMDSSLRGVLELYDARGQRLLANRGYFGLDPLLDFLVPEDGIYAVKLFDLTYTGSADHFYRLDIDAGPRGLFTVPSVVERGKTTAVTLYGWNLRPREAVAGAASVAAVSAGALNGPAATGSPTAAEISTTTNADRRDSGRRELDQVTVDVTPPAADQALGMNLPLRPCQVSVDSFTYTHPGGHAPVLVSVTDVPVTLEQSSHQSPGSAQLLAVPTEVSGQLIQGNEYDWYSIPAQRGEVLWIELFGERIGSPVDLDVAILDANGTKPLAHFADELDNLGGTRFPSQHLDPAGRWVAPTDGKYLILVRNLIGGLDDDPRRIYRLSVRREEPDMQVAVVSRRTDAPSASTVSRGGREMSEVLAFRQRGQNGSIRISALNLPAGIECPDIWLGPGVNRAPLIVTAADGTAPFVGALNLVATAETDGAAPGRVVRGATMVRTGLPRGAGRITNEIPLAVAGESPLRINAIATETKLSQGSVIDVAIEVIRRNPAQADAVELSGVGLPDALRQQTSQIPAGADRGYISFVLPAGIPVGKYTFAVRAETTVLPPGGTAAAPAKPQPALAFSNPITFEVYPATIIVEVDSHSARQIRRGKTAIVKYTAQRRNGFIGKIHTDLGAPGGVVGLRGRGVTFTGQTEVGEIQVIANEDAPLGIHPLHLQAVGTVEDQPLYRARCLLELEIVE